MNIRLRDLMTATVATMPPRTPLNEAAREMARRHVSSLVITDADQSPIGIVTERDVLAAFRARRSSSTALADIMSAPLRTATPDTSLAEAFRLMLDHKLHHLVVLDERGGLAGIVSDSDFRPHLARCPNEARNQIRYIMNPCIPLLGPDASIGDAASLMDELGATCVVMEQRRRPLGIFTLRDLVRSFELYGATEDVRLEVLEQLPLAPRASSPVHTISARATPTEAWDRLAELGLRHLVVVDSEGRVMGLITQAELLRHRDYTALLAETESLTTLARNLAESQAKLRAVFNGVNDLTGLLLPDGTLIEANRPSLTLIGADAAALIGRPFWDTPWWSHDPLQVGRLRQSIEQAVTTGSDVRFDGVHLDARGHRHLMDCLIRPILDDHGRVGYVLAVGRDVTELKQEYLLRDGQGRILEMIARGKEDIDRILLAIVRLAESAVPVMRAAVLLARDDRLHVAMAPSLPPAFNTMAEGLPIGPGKGTSGAALHQRQRVLTPSTAEAPGWQAYQDFARTCALAACWSQPILASDGRALGCFAMYFDAPRSPTSAELDLLEGMANLASIALERIESTRALESERGRLLALLDAIPDAVFFKDPGGVYLGCNRSFRERFRPHVDAIEGLTDFDLASEERARSYRENDLAAMHADQPVIREEWARRPDGQLALFETTKAPVRTPDGALLGTVGVARDISARREAETKLRLAASVFDHSHDGILITDPAGNILEANTAMLRQSGYALDEVVCRRIGDFRSADHAPGFYASLWRALRKRGFWQGEIHSRRKEGAPHVLRLAVGAVRDTREQVTHYVWVFTDITALKDSQYRLEQLAHYDPLTRLPNRALLSERMRHLLARADREQALLAVCYLDLDGFKPINDSHGHHVGDRLLVELGSRLSATVRGGDTVARLGGDEFVLLLSELRTIAEMETILARVLARMAEPVRIDALQLHVSASIGVTLYPLDQGDPDTLLRHADQAMYQAKEAGRDTYRLFDTHQDQQARSARALNERVRQALEQGELVLHYQPKVDLHTTRLVGMEALLRWQHPDEGLLPPGHFLPAVEDSPLAEDIDQWVIGEALRQMAVWRREGLNIPVSVNVTARGLQHEGLRDWLSHSLATHPEVPAHWLELEILESKAMEDVALVGDAIRACAELGVLFALDDFGTGYSSLTYLRRLPAQVLKIDRSFVAGMLDDAGDRAIVEGVIGLAAAFDRAAIAEGVERPEQGRTLVSLGCRVVQGYGIARPMPADAVPDWARSFRLPQAWREATPGSLSLA